MLGADFEKFIGSLSTGQPVPATVLGLNGKNGDHTPLFFGGENVGTIHRDNTMIEMCPPAKATAEEFSSAIRMCLLGAEEFLREFDSDLFIMPDTIVRWPEEVLFTKEAKDIGCDRDFLSNNDSVARQAVTAHSLGEIRCTGGHLHVSYDTRIIPPWVAAEIADVFVGIPMQKHLNGVRAPYYGLSTLHRPTSYPDGSFGMEYRVMDSFWVDNQDLRWEAVKRMELVQKLLTERYIPAVQLLAEMHHRLVPREAVVATYDSGQLQLETMEIMHTAAPELLEEYSDTIR